jgi:hypothetical protein
MTVAIIVDSLWLLLLKDQFYYEKGPSNPLLLSESMWKYNHYVVYASLVTLCFKVLRSIPLDFDPFPFVKNRGLLTKQADIPFQLHNELHSVHKSSIYNRYDEDIRMNLI